MSSLCAASITVLPLASTTALPSTSRFNILVSDIAGNQTLLVIDVVLEFAAKMLDEALDRQCGGVSQRAYGAAGDVVGDGDQQVEVFVPALPVLDAIDHAPQPSGPLAAWRALTAGLLEIEIREAQERSHHAARLVHDDHRPRSEHRSGFGNRVVIHIGRHHDVGGQHRHRRAAGNARLELASPTHTARHVEERRKRKTQLDLEVARPLDVACDRKDLGAAVVGTAQIQKRFSSFANDPRDCSEGLGVVDRGWLPVHAEARRERRLETRHALLAFERFQQRRLLAANVGAVAVAVVQMEAEAAAENIVAEQSCLVGLLERFFAALVRVPDFAMDVVVAALAAHRIRGDGHALDQDMRVVTQDVAILESSGLAFVGVAHQILVAAVLLRHEAPLEAGREACAATPAQPGFFYFRAYVRGRDFFGEDLFQRLVAAARDVVAQPPVVAIEAGEDQRVGSVIQKFGRRVHRFASAESSAIKPSSCSGFIQLHMRLLLTSTTGASPQAPKHSPSLSVNRPSAVVSPKPMPSFCFRCAAAWAALESAQGRFVQIVSLYFPVGSVSNIS